MMEITLAGRYKVVKALGSGGFGQTFLAQDIHLPGNPLCVVKQLKLRVNEPAALETAKRLFDREAQTLYRLGDQDQIPRLLAHFEQDEEFYLVQEFIEGQPLNEEFAKHKQLSEASVIGLLQDILQVLAFVHQQNVIHRDIKPANLIRRRKDGKIVLIDFGAVKEVSTQAVNSHGQTSLTVAVGSRGYMPSEQQSFKPHFSSDIYAVGIVCLQALTGLSPRELPQDACGEFSCAILCDRTPINPGLTAILDKMVRYDYRQRYTNATEALQAVEQLISQGESVTYETPTILTPIQPCPSATADESPEQVSLEVERPPVENVGRIFGLDIGLMAGLIIGLGGCLLSGLMIVVIVHQIEPVETLKWSWTKAQKNRLPGLRVGVMVGLVFALIFSPAMSPVYGIRITLIDSLSYGLSGLGTGLIFILLQGLTGSWIETRTVPNQGIWQSAKNAIVFTLIGLLSLGLVAELVGGRILIGITTGLLFGMLSPAGIACLQHFALRFVLYCKGYIPWNYARFLDYATQLIFLQKVGGGYIFIHRLLLEHFAGLPAEPVKP